MSEWRSNQPINRSQTSKIKQTVPKENQRIQEMGGHVIFGRILGKLAISRAFGDFQFKEFDEEEASLFKGPILSSIPDIFYINLDLT